MHRSALSLRRRHTPRRTLLSLAVTALAWSSAQQVHAQAPLAPAGAASAPAGGASAPVMSAEQAAKVNAAANEKDGTQSVVVTATRRREPSREVPMRVDVLPTQQLEQAGARTLTDYLAAEPGIDVKTTGGVGQGAISIRGVTTGDQVSNTVGTYIDDVAAGSSTAFANGYVNAIDMALLDLNHIEVLRGPQGTLYGAGAMGGVLKYVTNEPDTYEFSGSVSVGGSFTHSGAPSNTESAVVNVPLKEDVAGLRISGFTDKEGGNVDTIGPAPGARNNSNSGRTEGGRVSILIEPSNRFKVRLTQTAQLLKRNGGDFVDYDPTTGRPVDFLTNQPSGKSERAIAEPEPYMLKIAVTGADLEYDMGWARLNSITSVQQTRYDVTRDYSLLFGPAFGVQTAVFNNHTQVKKQSQEFRITSKGGGSFEWLGGLWWDHETATNDQHVPTTDSDGAPGTLLDLAAPSTYREIAAYGDLTWNATKSFSITAGMRVARNEQKFSQTGAGDLIGGSIDTSQTSGETAKTYLLTAKYALTPTSNAYVRAASGYRPGGPNFVTLDQVTGLLSPSSFQHDTLWSYEAGYKADLLDRILSIEAAIYDIEWHNIQQVLNKNGVSGITNSGDARIKGAEFAASFKPTSHFTLGASVALNDARLTSDADGIGSPSGSLLPNTPRVGGAFSGRYSFDLAAHAAYVGLAERFTGARDAGFKDSPSLPQYRLPSYALTDLQAGIDYKKLSLSFFVRNLFDRRVQLEANTTALSIGGPVLVTESRPREIGMSLTSSF